ncbi:MAG: hypothetical protein WC940_02730 [Candidatus Paceibacterota bacterium]|jgi:hypothetical protein
MINNYRSLRQKAINLIVMDMPNHKELISKKMIELGYSKKENKLEKEEVEETLSPKEEKKEEKIVNKAQKEIDKIIKEQTKK